MSIGAVGEIGLLAAFLLPAVVGCADSGDSAGTEVETSASSEAPTPSLDAAARDLEGPSVEVTILTTNAADTIGQGEWSFAAWVELEERAILFDSGWSPRNVLENARALGVDLSRAEELVLSHHHGDHTGGVETLRRELMAKNPKALSRIHVAEGIFDSRPLPGGGEGNPMVALKTALEELGSQFVVHSEPTEIAPSVWVTGPVPRVHPEYFYPRDRSRRAANGETVPDTVPESQSLVILARGGPILISGCGHAGLRNTLDHSRQTVSAEPVQAAIGGFHLFASSDEDLEPVGDALEAAGVENFLGSHCTGIESVYRIRQLAGLSRETARVGAIGTKFVSGVGIQAGAINR